jgi:hypothetical protein
MSVIQFTEHGDYDKLRLRETGQPALKDGQLLIKLTYAAVMRAPYGE